YCLFLEDNQTDNLVYKLVVDSILLVDKLLALLLHQVEVDHHPFLHFLKDEALYGPHNALLRMGQNLSSASFIIIIIPVLFFLSIIVTLLRVTSLSENSSPQPVAAISSIGVMFVGASYLT
ncbi:hypothetical protein Tco_0998096, partial [Tanacetum coccineum]